MRSPEANRKSLFRVPPFPAFPSADRYVAVGTLKDSLNRVVRSVEAREVLSLVIGPPGTGKSLLTQLLAKHFSAHRTVVQLGDAALEKADAFHRHLLHQLGVDLRNVEGGDLHLALVDQVKRMAAAGAGLLVLIDEAQSLAPEVLEAVRMATNVMIDGQPRVCAVLCGGPKLDETLATPSMEPLTQRVATRCYLHPMNAAESREFISQSIRKCGGNPDQTINDEAISSVFHASGGVPRLINQLMTEAIDAAEQLRQTLIDGRVIDQAWATLQQLPSPIIEEPQLAEAPSSVEFGSLSDWGDAEDEQGFAPEVCSDELTEDASESVGITVGNEAELELEPELELDFEAQSTDSDAAPCGDGCVGDYNQDVVVPADQADEVCTAKALELLVEDESMEEEVLPLATMTNGSTAEWANETVDDEAMCSTSSIVAGAVVETSPFTSEAIAQNHSVVDVVGRCDVDLQTPSNAGAGDESGLFGEFDMEEEIAVGVPTRDDTPTPQSPPIDDEVEVSIKRDIDEMTEEVVNAKIGVEQGDGSVLKIAADSESSVMWLSEDGSGNVTRDDSDMLVVEEDLPGDVPPPASQQISATQASEGQAVAVDFQAMLAKMRGTPE